MNLRTSHFRTFGVGLVLIASLAFTSGCTGGSSDDGHDHGEAGHSHDDGHDHDHDHDGHDHDHDHDHDGAVEDHGTEYPLGDLTVGSVTMAVSQYGELEGGKELAFECAISAGTPQTIRAWVGQRTGIGSMKGKGEKEDDGHFHVHVTCPPIIQVDHALWIEVEESGGAKNLGTLPLHR